MLNKIDKRGFISTNDNSPDTSSLTVDGPVSFTGAVVFNGVVTGSGFPTGSSVVGYDRLPLDFSTIAMYYFDGNLNDSSTNGYNLSVANDGTAEYQVGPKKRKYLANQVPTALSSSVAALRPTGSLTFEFVGKSIPIGDAVLIAIGDSSTWNWSVQIKDSGRYFVKVYFTQDGNEFNKLLSNVYIPFNEVFYIAVTRLVSGGNTTTNIYLNGVNVGTQTVLGTVPRIASGATYVLSWNNLGFTWYENDGQNQARQMHICNRVMSLSEIQSRALTVLPPGY